MTSKKKTDDVKVIAGEYTEQDKEAMLELRDRFDKTINYLRENKNIDAEDYFAFVLIMLSYYRRNDEETYQLIMSLHEHIDIVAKFFKSPYFMNYYYPARTHRYSSKGLM